MPGAGCRGFEGDRPIRPWLYKIATNVCLDMIAKRPKRILPADHGPPAGAGAGAGDPVHEPIWLEPYPDEMLAAQDQDAAPDARYELRESVELAFIAALQHLPASQRAVLILREVLGILGPRGSGCPRHHRGSRSTASCSAPARRWRSGFRSGASRQRCARLATTRSGRRSRRYIEAWESRDVDAMVAMLVEDATFAMPPLPGWFSGRDAVIAFITTTGRPRLRSVVTRASGQPTVGWYLWDSERGMYAPASLEVLALEGARVRDITAFLLPEMYPALRPSA